MGQPGRLLPGEAGDPARGRPTLSELKATARIGDEVFEVVGRTAELISLLVLHTERVNAPAVGKIVAHFAHGQAGILLIKDSR